MIAVDSPIDQHIGCGMWGMVTPGAFSETRRKEVQPIDETSVVGSRLSQIGLDDHGKEDREKTTDMEPLLQITQAFHRMLLRR